MQDSLLSNPINSRLPTSLFSKGAVKDSYTKGDIVAEGEFHRRIRKKWISTGISIQEFEDILNMLQTEFPTIQMAEERYNRLSKEARKLYSVSRAYYDLTQEYRQKWLGE